MKLLSTHARCFAAIFFVLLSAQLAAGCGLLSSHQNTDPNASQRADPNVGYALLYKFVATQKNSDKLLIIRKVSPEVEALMDQLSTFAGELDGQLKDIAKHNPEIKLDAEVLPAIEVKSRESAQFERTKQFLTTTGKPFERLLLLTQSGALTSERHLTRVMRDAEQDPERKQFWTDAQAGFDRIYEQLLALLEQQYYSADAAP